MQACKLGHSMRDVKCLMDASSY